MSTFEEDMRKLRDEFQGNPGVTIEQDENKLLSEGSTIDPKYSINIFLFPTNTFQSAL